MRAGTIRTAFVVLALLVGAAFAVGHDDQPCTCGDHGCTECTCGSDSMECTCETVSCTCGSDSMECTCDSIDGTCDTPAPVEDTVEGGCQGCPGHGCH